MSYIQNLIFNIYTFLPLIFIVSFIILCLGTSVVVTYDRRDDVALDHDEYEREIIALVMHVCMHARLSVSVRSWSSRDCESARTHIY